MPGVDFWINADGAKTGADQYLAALLRIDRSAQETALHLEKMSNAGAMAGQKATSSAANFLKMTLGIGSLGAVAFKSVQYFRALINEADHLNDLSKRFDLPVEMLSAMSDEAQKSGASIDQVARAMQQLATSRRNALADTKGTSAATQAFDELSRASGVTLNVVSDLPTLFDRTAEALAGVKDAATQASIAQRIFGRGGGELLPFFEQIASGGGVKGKVGGISTEFAEAADRWNDATKSLDTSFKLLLSKLSPLIEGVASLVETLAKVDFKKLAGADAQIAAVGIEGKSKEWIDLAQAVDAARAEVIRIDEARFPLVGLRPGIAMFAQLTEQANKAIDTLHKAEEAFHERFGIEPPTPTGPRGGLQPLLAESRPAAAAAAKAVVTTLTLEQQKFIDKLKDQQTQLGLTGFALDEFRIRQEALAANFETTAEGAALFARTLEGSIRSIRDAQAIATATTAIDAMGDAFDRIGKTDAELRLLDFNKALALIGSKSTDIAGLRDIFVSLNKELERRVDEDVFTKRIDAMREEIPLILLAVDAREQENAVLELMRSTQNRATDAQKDSIRALVQQRQELERLQKAADDAANAIVQGFEDAILQSSTLTQVIRNLGLELSRIGLRTFLQPASNALSGFFGQALGAASAHGNAFAGGHVLPFARGGVVTSPTFFPMARGAGLMGESGPEAVMPLRQGPRGLSIRSDALGGLLPIGRVGGDLGVTLFGRGGLVPSGTLRGGVGGGGDMTTVNLVQNVTIRGGTDGEGARRSARQMAGDFRRALERSSI